MGLTGNVICDYCGQPAKKVRGGEMYPHRPDLWELKIWDCRPCGAYVGTHKGTDWVPLGRLANKELRYWKMQAHAKFDPAWKSKRLTRREAYKELADKLGIPFDKCHIGHFDVPMCKRVVEVLS